MKECRYCRTIYEDSLSACPNCGGTKIITAQEKAEDAALYQKEIVNRENAVAVVASKRKMQISVLVGIVVLIIAVISIASYNVNKPLSNGMTKDEGEAVLAEGIAFYDTGDYESAIECFAQLPSDSKQYDEAQSMLKKSEESYLAEILKKTDAYVQNEEYEVALELLSNGLIVLPDSGDLKNAYNSTYAAYKSMVCTAAISDADSYVAEDDYEGAIKILQTALDKIGNDDEISAILVTIENEFVEQAIAKALIAFVDEGYTSAINICENALSIVPDSIKIQEELNKYEEYIPVSLFSLDIEGTAKYFGSSQSRLYETYDITDLSGNHYSNAYCDNSNGGSSNVYYLNYKYNYITFKYVRVEVPDHDRLASISVYNGWSGYTDDAILLYKKELSLIDRNIYEVTLDISNCEYLQINMWDCNDGIINAVLVDAVVGK